MFNSEEEVEEPLRVMATVRIMKKFIFIIMVSERF